MLRPIHHVDREKTDGPSDRGPPKDSLSVHGPCRDRLSTGDGDEWDGCGARGATRATFRTRGGDEIETRVAGPETSSGVG